MTYVQCFRQAENELSKATTDRATWEFVEEFWQQTFQCDAALLDRVALLESRMERHHGWCRQ